MGAGAGAAALLATKPRPPLGLTRLCLLPPAPTQVTSIHVDRLKVVTGTDRYGPSPVRVWCADTGEALAQLETSLPPAAPPAAAEAADAEPGGGGAGEGAAAAGQQGQQVGGDDEAAPDSPPARPHHQYNRGWEGATALAVRGALLVSGSSEGTVLERDFSRGGLPELEAAPWERCSGLAGKFWQLGGGGRG